MKNKYLKFIVTLLTIPCLPGVSKAAGPTPSIQPTSDCVIRSFVSMIDVRKDASLHVQEDFDEDCGTLSGKHGMFRVLPLQKPSGLVGSGYDQFHVRLESTTDEKGNPVQDEETNDGTTVTWKIGESNVTIQGTHHFRIIYDVENATAFGIPDSQHDELAWNLTGNFWKLPIVSFRADIRFPFALQEYTAIFSGNDEQTNALAAVLAKPNATQLTVSSTLPLMSGQAISLRQTFPTGIISPYQKTWTEKNGNLISSILMVLAQFTLPLGWLLLHLRYGGGPKPSRTVAPAFAPPPGVNALEAGLLNNRGKKNNSQIAALITDFSRQGYVTIAKQQGNTSFILENADKANLQHYERTFLNALFKGQQHVTLSDLRESAAFSKAADTLHDEALERLEAAGLLDRKSFVAIDIFRGIAALLLLIGIGLIFSPWIMAGIILLVLSAYSFLCSLGLGRYTVQGAQLESQIRGYKLFIKTADRYRAPFNEQQGIIDEILPYAVAFGVTKEFAVALHAIGGKEADYRPSWFITPPGTPFSIDTSFTAINQVTLEVADSVKASSSGGGGGGSFGGGGGGGSW